MKKRTEAVQSVMLWEVMVTKSNNEIEKFCVRCGIPKLNLEFLKQHEVKVNNPMNEPDYMGVISFCV